MLLCERPSVGTLELVGVLRENVGVIVVWFAVKASKGRRWFSKSVGHGGPWLFLPLWTLMLAGVDYTLVSESEGRRCINISLGVSEDGAVLTLELLLLEVLVS